MWTKREVSERWRRHNVKGSCFKKGEKSKKSLLFPLSLLQSKKLFFFFFHIWHEFWFVPSPCSAPPTFSFELFAATNKQSPDDGSDIVALSYTALKCPATHVPPCHLHKMKFSFCFLVWVLCFKMSVMLLSHSRYLENMTTEQFL